MFQPEQNLEEMEKRRELTLRRIFAYLMENGYCPTYEKTHIIFGLDDNMAVLEYEESVLSVRLFFSIDKEECGNFIEASNECMVSTFMVKPVVLNDMDNIMFSCETLCDTFRDFRKFFPRMLAYLAEGLLQHKKEMKRILITEGLMKATLPVAEDMFPATGNARKVLS